MPLAERAPWVRLAAEALLRDPAFAGSRASLAALAVTGPDGPIRLSELGDWFAIGSRVTLAGPQGSGRTTLLRSIAYDHADRVLKGDASTAELAEHDLLPVWLGAARIDPADPLTPILGAIQQRAGTAVHDLAGVPLLLLLDGSLESLAEQALLNAFDSVCLVTVSERAGPAGAIRIEPLSLAAAFDWLQRLAPQTAPAISRYLTRHGLWGLTERPLWGRALVAAWQATAAEPSPPELLQRIYIELAGDYAVLAEPAMRALAALPGAGQAVDVLRTLVTALGSSRGEAAMGQLIAGALVDQEPGGALAIGSRELRDLFRADWLRAEWSRDRRIPQSVIAGPLSWSGAVQRLLSNPDDTARLVDDWLRDCPTVDGFMTLITAAVRAGVRDRIVPLAVATAGSAGRREALARALATVGLASDAAALLRDVALARPTDRALQTQYARVLSAAGQSEAARAVWDRLAKVEPDPFEAAVEAASVANAGSAVASLTALDALSVRLERMRAQLAVARSSTLLVMGDVDQAISVAQLAAESTDEPGAWRALGNALLAKGLSSAAREAFQRSAPRGDDLETIRGIARSWQDEGLPNRALAELDRALAERPDDAGLYVEVARAYRLLSRPDLARLFADHAVQMAANLPAAQLELAALNEASGDLEAAATAYQRVLDETGDGAIAVRLASIRRSQGQFAEAERLVREAVVSQPNRAEWFNQLGVLLLEQDQLEAAVAQFQRALELQPQLALAHRNLADALARSGDTAGALAELDLAIQLALEHDPVTGRLVAGEAHNLKGQVLDRAGRFAEALAEYQAASSLLPDEPAFRVSQAEALTQLEDHQQLLAILTRAVDVRPDDPSARFELGRAQERLGNLAEASVHFRRAVQLRPADADARVALAAVLRRLGSFEEAIEVLAASDAPATPLLQQELALSLEQGGRLEEALETYRRAVRSDVESSRLWLAIGRVSRRLGRLDEGQVALRTAVALDAQNPSAHAELALCYQHQGRYEEALGQIMLALELDPDNGWTSYQAATLLRQLRRDGEAARYLRRAVDLEPEHASWKAELGRLYERLGRGQEALQLLQDAAAQDPTNSETLTSVASLQRRAGRPADAVVALEHALAWDPTNPAARIQRAWALLDLGDTEGALAAATELTGGALETPEVHALRAAALERRGELEAALASLQVALAAEPNRTEWLRQLASLSLRQGRSAEAEDAIRQALSIEASAPLFRDLGVILLQRGQPEAAIAMLQRALLEARDLAASEQAWWRLDLGDACLANGDPVRAQREYELARELGVDQDAIDLRTARLAMSRGDSANALRLLDRLPGVTSQDLQLRVRALLDSGRPEDAVAALEGIIGDAAPAGLLRLQAQALAAAGRRDDAIAAISRVIEAPDAGDDRERSNDFLQLALWLQDGGRREEAAVHFRSSVRLDPQNAEARLAAGRFFLDADETEPAHLHLAAAVDLLPGSAEGHALLGRVLERMNQFDAATRAYDMALRLGAEPAVSLSLARLLSRSGLPGDAVRHARRVVESEPDNAAAWSLLGELLVALGEYGEAAQTLKRAAALAPDDADLAGRAGLALAAIGEDRAGIALLDRAVALGDDPGRWAEALGDILADRGRDEEALVRYQAAVKAGSASVGLRAKVLRRLGTPEANRELMALLEEHPRDATVVFEAALQHPVVPASRLSPDPRNDETIELLRRANALAPDRPQIALALADALRNVGRVAETVAVLDGAYSQQLSVSQRLRRADLWRAVQRWNEAIEDVTEAQRASGDAFLGQKRIQLLREAGRSREALAVLTQLTATVPATPALERLRAEILLDLGETDGAIEAIERAIKRDPRGEYFLVLGFALERANRFEAAKQALREAMKLGADATETSQRLASVEARQTIERQRQRLGR